MPDALNYIFQGREGTGIAQEFPQSSYDPVRASAMYVDKVKADLEKARREREAAQARGREILAIKPEGWDLDTQREIVPKINEMKTKFVDYYLKGIDPTDPYKNLDAYQDIENRKTEIAGLVNSSKQQQEFYNKTLQSVLTDKEGKYDREAALQRLAQFRGAPTVKDRVSQMEGFDLPLTYDVRKDLEDVFKGLKAEDSRVEVKPFGMGLQQITQHKEVPEKELRSRLTAALRRTGEKGQKFQDALFRAGYDGLVQSGEAVVNNGVLYDKAGKPIPRESVMEKGLGWAMDYAKSTYNERSSQYRDIPKAEGGDNDPGKLFTWTPGAVPDFGDGRPSTSGEAQGKGTGGIWHTDDKNRPYVAVNYNKTATDNAPLYANDGRQLNPLGFIKGKNGWELVAREVIQKPIGDGMNQKFASEGKRVQIPLAQADDAARMAAYFRFENVQDFEKFLDKKVGSTAAAKPAANENKWSKYKR